MVPDEVRGPNRRRASRVLLGMNASDLTREQIFQARDAYPDYITAETSADALGLPERYTSGGLPIYPPESQTFRARAQIAAILSGKGPR